MIHPRCSGSASKMAARRRSWSLAEQSAHPEERLKIVRFYRRAAIDRVEVDPQRKLALDEKRINKRTVSPPNMRPVTKLF